METTTCDEGSFHIDIKLITGLLHLIDDEVKTCKIGKQKETSIKATELYSSLYKSLLALRDNDYFWFSFENYQVIKSLNHFKFIK